jgi:nitrogen fixation protein NifQ
MGAAAFDYQRLMAGAADPADIVTLAFGGVLARFPVLGLEAAAQDRLLRQYFPGIETTAVTAYSNDSNEHCQALPADEFDDLRALLMAHRSEASEEMQWLACAIATACLGNSHLWQDMGLPNRDVLSQLLRRYFMTLYEKNIGNMKWKKFFYKQLCEQAEVMLCKAPSCQVCTDYVVCFGPEDAGPLTAR